MQCIFWIWNAFIKFPSYADINLKLNESIELISYMFGFKLAISVNKFEHENSFNINKKIIAKLASW